MADISGRPTCSSCGRFFKHEAGVAWRMVYSGSPLPEPDDTIFRCRPCVDKLGPFRPQPGIMPEYSCGIVKEVGHTEG